MAAAGRLISDIRVLVNEIRAFPYSLPLVFDSLLLLVLPVPTVLPGRPVSTEVKENKKSLHETNEAALVIAHVMAP